MVCGGPWNDDVLLVAPQRARGQQKKFASCTRGVGCEKWGLLEPHTSNLSSVPHYPQLKITHLS